MHVYQDKLCHLNSLFLNTKFFFYVTLCHVHIISMSQFLHCPQAPTGKKIDLLWPRDLKCGIYVRGILYIVKNNFHSLLYFLHSDAGFCQKGKPKKSKFSICVLMAQRHLICYTAPNTIRSNTTKFCCEGKIYKQMIR